VNRSAALVRTAILFALIATVLAPAGPSVGAIKSHPEPIYLALGDSYSAGEGLGPFLPGSGSCDRSPKSYPEIVAHHIGDVKLKFLACSAATIAQIDQQVSVLPSNTLHHVEITTVTAGGNDLPFSGLITACVGAVNSTTSPTIKYLPGVSSPTLCANEISGAAKLLGAGINPVTGDVTIPMGALIFPLSKPSPFETRLSALYVHVLHSEGAVKNRAAGPRLLVVQYPSLMGSPGVGACLLSATPLPSVGPTTTVGISGPLYPAFSNANGYALGDINSYVQLETSVVAETLRRDGYLDVLLIPSNVGFAPLNCATGTSPDINGLILSDTAPAIEAASFHPTAVGQAVLASSVLAKWRGALH